MSLGETVGRLCLSLASVRLAWRMWSPLTRSLYVNMRSGPDRQAGGRTTSSRSARKRFSVCIFTRRLSETDC
uniref:Uncharacterized protein n=1 Tax=Ailuropoda melanoleuca TaxID=9646 RepID=A0A7N5KJ77_AILME